jgi:uncharacterized protein YndB with AHSA1/START domain
MAGSTYVYVTYIRTTPTELWNALTDEEFTQQYWFGVRLQSDWTVGAPWKMLYPDGRLTDSGEVLEVDPPKRLVLRWRNEFRPELKAEGYARCVFELEPTGDVVKLTVTHSIDVDNSQLITAVSGGWPRILSNLKSLLETGAIIMATK